MFGFDPDFLAKMLRIAGVRVRFPLDQRVMIVERGADRTVITLDELEKKINGEQQQGVNSD